MPSAEELSFANEPFDSGEPHSLTWRIAVAYAASQLFAGGEKQDYVKAIFATMKDPPADRAATIVDLIEYVHAKEVSVTWGSGDEMAIMYLVFAMERAGMLYDWGRVKPKLGPLGHHYLFMGGPGPHLPHGGDLWLAPLFGAELLVPVLGSVCIRLYGGDRSTGVGSGLVLDANHILTNAHVAKILKRGDEICSPEILRPGLSPGPDIPLTVTAAHFHQDYDDLGDPREGIDVGIVEVEPSSPTPAWHRRTLNDLVFREPRWADDVLMFGYPRIAGAPTTDLVVQQGQVTNPLVVEKGEVVNPSVSDYREKEFFLFSAIARPGSSGGPIVAADGRIIGITAHEPIDVHADDGNPVTPFYRGVPTDQIIKALSEIGCGHERLITTQSALNEAQVKRRLALKEKRAAQVEDDGKVEPPVTA